MVKKRWAFAGAAWALGALFLGGVLAVGHSSAWFGLGELAAGEEPAWRYQYRSTWDPALDPVEGLSVSWGCGPVEVRTGEGALVVVTEYAQEPLSQEEQLGLSSSGGELRVRWDGELLSLGALGGREKRLVVELPQAVAAALEDFSCANLAGNVAVEGVTAGDVAVRSLAGDVLLDSLSGGEVQVSTVSGDICWEGGRLESLELATTSGQVGVRGVSAAECSLSTVTGEVAFSGAAGEAFAAETVSGPVEAALSACPKEARMESVSGLLRLRLPENQGFVAQVSTVSGGFSSQFLGAGDGAPGTLRYGSGAARLAFSTTSGAVELLRAG